METNEKVSAYLTTEPIPFLRKAEKETIEATEELLNVIAKFAHRLLCADACSIFLVTPRGRTAEQVAGTGYQERFVNEAKRKVVSPEKVIDCPQKLDEKLGLVSWVISKGLPFLSKTPEELTGHAHHRGDCDRVQSPNTELIVQTLLAVPIKGFQQEVMGAIKAERIVSLNNDVFPFSEDDEYYLSNIAVSVGRCLYYIKMAKNKKPLDAIAAWALDVFSMSSTSEPDLSRFLNVVAKLMAVFSNADSCSVFLLNEERTYLMQYGGHGYQARGNLVRTYKMPKDGTKPSDYSGLTAHIALTGLQFYAQNNQLLTRHEAHKGTYDDLNFNRGEKCTAFFGLPVQIGATTIGVFKVENNTEDEKSLKDPFPEDVRRWLNILVQDLALFILRLRNQANTRNRVIEKSTKSIIEILQGGGNWQSLVKRAIEDISKTLGAEACSLFIKEGDKLVQYDWGAFGYAKPIPTQKRREYQWIVRDSILGTPKTDDGKVGLTVWIASTGNKFLAQSNNELISHPHHMGTFDNDNFEKGQRCDSFIGIPLQVHKPNSVYTLGVLKIENKTDEAGNHIPFSKEDELVFELLASSLSNALYFMREKAGANRDLFILSLKREQSTDDPAMMWALGLKRGTPGLSDFNINLPPLPDNCILVRTLSLGICGTDINSFGGDRTSDFDLVEFHEALGCVEWVGDLVDKKRFNKGDIVIPIVRRCQTWTPPTSGINEIVFNFPACNEASHCPSYRRPDACPRGEYPFSLQSGEYVGYRSRGTGKCHGFGSEFFIDTAEWLVPVKVPLKKEGNRNKDLLSRLILVEPLAVVWKMKREIEQVRPVRPLKDKILTIGLGPIGYLATVVMCTMHPGLKSTAVDKVPGDKPWIKKIRQFGTNYLHLGHMETWHNGLNLENNLFDIIIEATGNPQEVIGKAIDVLAPNGILVLLSVIGRDGEPDIKLSNDNLNAIVKKNGKIIGSVNESREDFENAIDFLMTFHKEIDSSLDALINSISLDKRKWTALKKISEIRETPTWERDLGPKIVLRTPAWSDFN